VFRQRMTQLDPELLADGAILAPITQENGQQKVVRLDPGEEEYAAWLGYMQRQRGQAPRPRSSAASDRGEQHWASST